MLSEARGRAPGSRGEGAVIARPATPGPWVDTNWRITPSVAAALKAAGKVGIGRYVPLPNNPSAGDITGTEVGCILDAGLDLLLVQHVRRPPWYADMHSGRDDGLQAAKSATEAGYPNDCHLWLDLEGLGQGMGGSALAVGMFANDWARAVIGEGFRAGLYVGYAVPLSPVELYQLPGFTSYWSDAGHRLVAVRGVAIQQGAPEVTIAGVRFDPDVMAPDGKGDLPMVCAAG